MEVNNTSIVSMYCTCVDYFLYMDFILVFFVRLGSQGGEVKGCNDLWEGVYYMYVSSRRDATTRMTITTFCSTYDELSEIELGPTN